MFRNRILLCLLLGFIISGCKNGASDPKEAAQILTSVPTWKIAEITVNDKVTFKDGKMEQQFGGIEFDRYMETVQLKPDGTFSGIFKGSTEPFVMKWQAGPKQIEVGLPETKSGNWTIDPAEVEPGSFIMKTQSTAYDYPNTTKIALKFEAGK